MRSGGAAIRRSMRKLCSVLDWVARATFMSSSVWGCRGGQCLKAIERRIPVLPLPLDPGLDRPQRVIAHADIAPLLVDTPLDDAGFFKHLEVSRYGWRAHGEGRGDVADRKFALG